MIFLQPFQQVLEWLQVTGTGRAHVASRGRPPFAFLPRGAQRSWGAGAERSLWGSVGQQLGCGAVGGGLRAGGAGQPGLFYLQCSLSLPQ